jgi:NAD(P)-dependent dehydrogenase (short-subunit alcohol dehydrogenase family)
VTTTLITGANKGLGYETARQHVVWMGARDEDRGVLPPTNFRADSSPST